MDAIDELHAPRYAREIGRDKRDRGHRSNFRPSELKAISVWRRFWSCVERGAYAEAEALRAQMTPEHAAEAHTVLREHAPKRHEQEALIVPTRDLPLPQRYVPASDTQLAATLAAMLELMIEKKLDEVIALLLRGPRIERSKILVTFASFRDYRVRIDDAQLRELQRTRADDLAQIPIERYFQALYAAHLGR